MFYDDAFRRITEKSAFSQEAVLLIGAIEYSLKGIFCSGNYGFDDLDKGYSKKKGEARQSFKISRSSVPCMLTPSDLIRNTLIIDSRRWIIRNVTGNDSGILNLELVVGETDDV